METVELILAYEWTCNNCGRNNFESCVTLDLPMEEKVELAEQFDIELEEIDNGMFTTYPDNVTCKHCNTVYETERSPS